MRRQLTTNLVTKLFACVLTLWIPTVVQAAQPPIEQLYFHFFLSVVNEGKSLARQQSTTTVAQLKLADRLALSPSAAFTLKLISQNTIDMVSAQDARAQKIIDQFHAQHPQGRLKANEELPQAPEQLKELWNERQMIILSHVARLQTELSPILFQRIELYVMRILTRDLKTAPLTEHQLNLLRNARSSSSKGIIR